MDLNKSQNSEIKKGIQDFEMSLDKELLWDQIQKKKKKDRSVIWIFSGLLVIVMFLFLSFFIYNYNSTEKEIPVASDQAPKSIEFNTKLDKTKIKDQSNAAHSTEVSSTERSQLESNSNTSLNLNSTLETNTQIPKSAVVNGKSNSKIKDVAKHQADQKLAKVQQKSNTQHIAPSSKPISSSTSRIASNHPAEQKANGQSTNFSFGIKIPAKEMPVKLRTALNIDGLQTLTFSKHLEARIPKLHRPNFKTSYGIKKQKFKKKIRLSLLGGAGLVSGQFDQKVVEEFALPMEASTQILESTSFSGLLRLNLKPNFSIVTGLNYTQVNERFKFVEEFESDIEIDDVILKRITDQRGIVTEVFGTGTGTETSRYIFTVYNKYKHLNLPIIASFDHRFKRFGIHLEAGIMANLNFKFKGQTPIDADLVNEGNNAFKPSLGINYHTGISMDYLIGPKWNLTLRPSYTFGNQNIRVSNSIFTQSFNTLNIELGIGYNF